MDTIPVDFFEFDEKMSIEDIVKIWKKRGLWFFDIVHHEQAFFTINEASGTSIVESDGQVKKFSQRADAEQFIQDKNIINAHIVDHIYSYFTAQNKNGRFINNFSGTPKEFRKQENALRYACEYNADTVKIKLASGQFRTKKNK